MKRKCVGLALGAVLLAVAAFIVVMGLLHGLDGETQAAPAQQQGFALKWQQPPDLTPTGLDVSAFFLEPPFSSVLADDFLCTQTGPISQIEFWGSWLNNYGGPDPMWFTLSIHSNAPGPPYSQPGDLLWLHTYAAGECVATFEQGGVMEGFFAPQTGDYFSLGDSQVWRYTCPGPEGFIQQGTPQHPVTYWLDVQAYPVPGEYFGWKTSLQHWQDDAVWAAGAEPVQATDPPAWNELRYPQGHPMQGQSIDLAFRIWGGPDADADTVPDGTDNCMYVFNPDQTNTDVIVNPPGDGAGDACDCDDDNGGTPDNQEIRDGTNPLNPADDGPRNTNDSDNDKGLNWEEDWSGTDPFDRCGDDCNTTHTDDAWGYDINIDCWCNSSDILAFPANVKMPAQLGVEPSYKCRYDVAPDKWINSSDILLFPARVAMPKQCTNP